MDSQLASLMDLSSRVAIVTGAAIGIGEGIARVLARAGAAVAIVDLSAEKATATADAIGREGGRAIAVTTDVADEAAVRSMIGRVCDHFGRIDVLVNNAAIFPMQSMREHSSEVWDRVIAVNLGGAYLCTRYAAERMIEGGRGGRIINVSTINTLRTYVGMPHYDVSKWALNGLTRNCALEYAPHGITVNAIAPGGVKTPGSLKVRTALGGGDAARGDAEVEKKIPLGRWGEAEEMGHAVWFLASAAAAYVTGQILYVDGGLGLPL